jgi:hypothetical protein
MKKIHLGLFLVLLHLPLFAFDESQMLANKGYFPGPTGEAASPSIDDDDYGNDDMDDDDNYDDTDSRASLFQPKSNTPIPKPEDTPEWFPGQ